MICSSDDDVRDWVMNDPVAAATELIRLRQRTQELYDQYWDFVNHINDQYGYPRGMISPHGYKQARRK